MSRDLEGTHCRENNELRSHIGENCSSATVALHGRIAALHGKSLRRQLLLMIVCLFLFLFCLFFLFFSGCAPVPPSPPEEVAANATRRRGVATRFAVVETRDALEGGTGALMPDAPRAGRLDASGTRTCAARASAVAAVMASCASAVRCRHVWEN